MHCTNRCFRLPLLAVAASGLMIGAELRAMEGLTVETPAGFVPGLPVLVRVEWRESSGRPARQVWDAVAELSVSQPGVTLSTNRVELLNGMGSALVTFDGASDLDLIVQCPGLIAHRQLTALDPQSAVTIGGTLSGESTTWSGLIRVTNDVIVPAGHRLTIEAGTWVLLNGVASGTNGADLQVDGELHCRGTAQAPVVLTCASAGLRWGQIRHAGALPSVYDHTIITLGGRARGEGHTGQAPVIRSSNSGIEFRNSSITDQAGPAGTPGKIMQATGSHIVMTNCLLSRARMGPEIGSTSLQFIDSYIIDMRGPDDADGIYLHTQQNNQVIRLAGSVVAGGDDDGIDTLGADITVEDCIVRGWKFPGDDSKGISVFGGECRVWRCLLIDNTIGLSGKGSDGENVRVRIDHTTILGNSFGVAVTNKSGTTPIIDYRITNSIILSPDPLFTQYDPADLHVTYSLVVEDWPGVGNLIGDPEFVDPVAGDFRLKPYSIAIDAGDPSMAMDPDGSRVDMGYWTFIAPPPALVALPGWANQRFNFTLNAYPNRNYVIESSTNAVAWTPWKTEFPTSAETAIVDADSGPERARFYRARLAP